MSDDTIKRSDAIKAVWGDDINPNEDGMVFEAQSHIDRDIRLIPSARPKGEWISNHDGSWNCSECGLRVFIYAKGNYCPNCGSDNRERNDDE